MVKVLWKRHFIKCTFCKSILKFDSEDVQEEKRCFGMISMHYIVCPVCKGHVYFQVNTKEDE